MMSGLCLRLGAVSHFWQGTAIVHAHPEPITGGYVLDLGNRYSLMYGSIIGQVG